MQLGVRTYTLEAEQGDLVAASCSLSTLLLI